MYAGVGIKSIGPRRGPDPKFPPHRRIFMARLLLPALVLAEIAGFVLVGRAVGVLGTLLLVIGATALGVWLLKRQGAEAMAGMRGTLQAGRDPRPALLRG